LSARTQTRTKVVISFLVLIDTIFSQFG
jgi:hypothetical protein